MMKRTLSLLLCLVMVLGLAAPSVQAADVDGVSGNIMDNIVIDDGANVDIVIDGERVNTSQETKLPNPVDLMTKEEDLPYTFGTPIAEEPAVEQVCECVDLASAVEHSGVCLVKAPYMTICEASVAELFTQWGNYTLVEQTFLLSYLQEKFPLKHYELEKLLNAPIGSASETYADGTTVSVEGIPQDGSLTVGEAADEVQEIVDAYVAEKEEASTPLFSYDVSVQDGEGADWQPETNVKMELELPGEKLHKNTKVFVVHVDDDGVATTIEATVTEDGKIAFETPGFSAFYGFTVDFHYEDITFSIPGMSSIKLSELFEELKMPLNASDVVALDYTDDTQIKIEQLEGDWLLTSLKAFSTEEKLTMTMADGTVYEIRVTDLEVNQSGSMTWDVYNSYHGKGVNHVYYSGGFPYSDSNNKKYEYIFNGWENYGNWDYSEDHGPTTMYFDYANQNITITIRPGTHNGHKPQETIYLDMFNQFILNNGANVTIQLSSLFADYNVKEVVFRGRVDTNAYFFIKNGSLTLKGTEQTKLVLDYDTDGDGTADNTDCPLIWENPKYDNTTTGSNTQKSLHLENVTFRNSTKGAFELRNSYINDVYLKNCTFEKTITNKLTDNYKETGKNDGLNNDGGMISILASTEYDLSRFELENCSFSGVAGVSSTSNRGGAISIERNVGNLTFTGCTFNDISAPNHGGAICVNNISDAAVSITNATFTGCVFTNCSAAGRGGAIRAISSTATTLIIDDCDFNTCTATTSIGGAVSWQGSIGNVTINNGSTFSDCYADGRGGAFSITCYQVGNILIDSSTFSRNTAVSHGGAVHVGINGATAPISVGTVNVTNCTFENNKSLGIGGGLCLTDGQYQSITLTNTTFDGCKTPGYGGGFGMKSDSNNAPFSVVGDVQIISCTFKNCFGGKLTPNAYVTYDQNGNEISDPSQANIQKWKASENAELAGLDMLNGASGSGAMILGGEIGGKLLISGESTKPMLIENCATWNNGGAICFADDLRVLGIKNESNEVVEAVTIQHLNINKCFARDSGSAIYFGSVEISLLDMNNCTIQNCGYFDENDPNFDDPNSTTDVASLIEISDDWFQCQNVLDLSKPTIDANGNQTYEVDKAKTEQVKAAQLARWKTYTLAQLSPGTDYSGTIRTVGNTACAAQITNCEIMYNRSATHGGAIYWNAGRIVYEDEATKEKILVAASLTITNTPMHHNYAKNRGGALFCEGNATIESCEIYNNTADGSGGGVAQNIYNNSSRQLGESGVNEKSILILRAASGDDPVKIYNNTARDGGGISITVDYTESYPHTLKPGIEAGSDAAKEQKNWDFKKDFTYEVTFNLGGTHVYGNTALHNGGGIYYNATYYQDRTDTPKDGVSWEERQRQVDSYIKNVQIDDGLIYSNIAGYGEVSAVKVTDASTLKAGDRLIIAAKDYDCAMSTGLNIDAAYTGYHTRQSTNGVKVGTDGLIVTQDMEVLTLVKGVPDGTFALMLPNGKYLRAAQHNEFKEASGVVESGSFTLSVNPSTGAASIVPGGSYNGNAVQYKATTGEFSPYEKENQSESAVVLYRVESGSDDIGGNGGGVYVNSNQYNTVDNIPTDQKTGSSTVAITGGEIYKNKAYVGNGGGVYLTGVNALCTISGETTTIGAEYQGKTGAKVNLSTDGANTATNRRISQNNYVGGCGGGIAIFGGARIKMEGGYIVNNVASTAGGGVAVHGEKSTMYLHEGYIDGNQASMGGGISLNKAKGDSASTDDQYKYGMYFDGGIIRNNIVFRNQDNVAYGGGICIANSATMKLAGGEVSTNKAVTDTGSGINTYASGQEGGGIAVCQGSELLIQNGSISGNKAYNGGGIAIRGDSTVTLNGSLTTGTDKDGNEDVVLDSQGSITGNYADYLGAGVYMADKTSEGSTFNMVSGYIAHNETSTKSWTKGGGIFLGMWCVINMTGGRIEYNEAYDGGAILGSQAVMNINNGVIKGNTARRNGGGIYDDYGMVTLTGGKIYNNNAASEGGGIFCFSENNKKYPAATLIISGGSIFNNSATSKGGGVFMDGGATQETQGTANITGGDIYSNTTNGDGGGLYVQDATLTMSQNGSIRLNTAQNGGGAYLKSSISTISNGTVDGNTASTRGGGIAVVEGGSINFSGGTFKNNEAKGSEGGGIYVKAAEVDISNGTFTNNAGKFGGGIFMDCCTEVEFTGGNVNKNYSNRGAGLFIRSCTVDIQNITVTGNECKADTRYDADNLRCGGGVLIDSPNGASTVTVNGGSFNENKAPHGAGLWISNNSGNSGKCVTVTINGGEVKKNEATGNGGGILLDGGGQVGASIVVNGVTTPGKATTLTMNGGKIAENIAGGNGGGLYVLGRSRATIRTGTRNNVTTVGEITENQANNGGGVYVTTGAELTVTNGYITYNQAIQPSDLEENDLLDTAKGHDMSLYGTGGGICVVNDKNASATSKFTLNATENNDDMAIYGNTATFSADDVFSSGNNTKLEIPKVADMNLAGFTNMKPEGWFEDYNTSDTSYGDGLNMIAKQTNVIPVLRYRNAVGLQRMHILPKYVTGDDVSNEVYVNKQGAYVAMTLGMPAAVDDTVVVDFSGSVNIDLRQNDLFITEADFGNGYPGRDYLTQALPEPDDQTVFNKNYVFFSTGDKPKVSYNITDDTAGHLTVMGKFSAWTGHRGVITFSPSRSSLKMDEVLELCYTVLHNGYWYYAKINVIPATTLYFEDHSQYIKYHNTSDSGLDENEELYDILAEWDLVDNDGNTLQKDPADPVQKQDRPGSYFLQDLDADNIYGYDDGVYGSCTKLSNNAAHKVTVGRHKAVDTDNNSLCDRCGVKIQWVHEYEGWNASIDQCQICLNTKAKHTFDTAAAHTCSDGKNYNEYCDVCSKWIGTHTTNARATFTFTGTGFDIISLCNRTTGLVMVSIYEQDSWGDIVFSHSEWETTEPIVTYMVDTWYQVMNQTLYQVPVIKADMNKIEKIGDDGKVNGYWGYGTYTVEIYIAPSFVEGEHAYNGADFYLDAIRIYSPAGYNGGNNQTIHNAYVDDGEGWPTYAELRMMFINEKELTQDPSEGGILFIDRKANTSLDMPIVNAYPTIEEYKSWGPNNEVYLASGQSVAFTLDDSKYGGNVAAVHLGMRALTGEAADVKVQYVERDDPDGLDGEATVIWRTKDSRVGQANMPQLGSTDMYYDVTAAMGKVLMIVNYGDIPIALSNLKVTHTSAPSQSSNLSDMIYSDLLTAKLALNVLTADELADPVVKPKRPALSFNGMVCYNVFFTAEDLGDLTAADLGLAVFNTYVPDGTVENADEVHLGATEIDGEYMVATDGVHAKYLGDTKYFRAFAKKADGSYVYSKMVSYSAVDYAKNILANSEDVKLKQLVAAMLNYGTEAQKYFGYKTDDLMNKIMTDDDQALLVGFDANSLNAVGKVDASKNGIFAHTGGFTGRRPAISFKGAFEINYFMTPAYAVDGDMTLYIWNEDTYNAVTELTAENADNAVVMTLENGSYTASSGEIIAKYLDKTVYVAAVYESEGVTYSSGVLPYSIAAYCQKPPAGVQDLATAAAIYGCTAKQYFGA